MSGGAPHNFTTTLAGHPHTVGTNSEGIQARRYDKQRIYSMRHCRISCINARYDEKKVLKMRLIRQIFCYVLGHNLKWLPYTTPEAEDDYHHCERCGKNFSAYD